MSEEWISAREALETISPGCTFVGPATETICRHAANGLIEARAKLFVVRGEGRESKNQDHRLPEDFWDMLLEKQDWMFGNFTGVKRSISWEIRCEAVGVFFKREGIEKILTQTWSDDLSKPKGRGRPRGSGTYLTKDNPIIEGMRATISANPGMSASKAADKFVEDAAGDGTVESKKRRLMKRYKERYPN